jgi:hypothetical protein
MAAKKKKFAPSGRAPVVDAQIYAAFIADLLSGTVKAEKLYESRTPPGRLTLDYDDPNG